MSTAAEEWIRRHRLNVDEYYRMAEVGLLAPDARVELIDGEIIDMAPIGSRHAATVDRLTQILVAAQLKDTIVGTQRPIRLESRSEPQPDLVLLKYRADFYSAAHPNATDVILLVEVSDTTWRYDREIKLPLYARHGIPQVWIIEPGKKQLHCFKEPKNGTYAEQTVMTPAQLSSVLIADQHLDLSGVFGD
jgi:Uma2 family endonuclease